MVHLQISSTVCKSRWAVPSEHNPRIEKVSNINFHPLQVVCRGSETQLQVGEHYLYLFNLRSNIGKSRDLNTHFIPNTCD